MPMYEYYCSTCRTRFERLVRVAPASGATSGSAGASAAVVDAERAPCPECGRPDAPRVLSTFATVRGGDGASLMGATGGACGCTPATCGCH